MVISGIIRPPPDIRAVADRTALFVSKNGIAFETKILNSEKGRTPKFAFLHDHSPFHAYYEDRIQFYLDGGTDEDEKRKEEEERKKREKEREEVEARIRKGAEEVEATVAKREATRKKASAVDPVARALLSSRARIEDAKRRALNASSSGGAEIDVDNIGDANDVDDKESAANITQDTGRRGVSNLPAWMTKDSSSTTTIGQGVSITLSSQSGLLPPSPLNHVTLVAPANLTPLAVEVMKLTAQYVALSEPKVGSQHSRSSGGDNFLTNLTLTQWTNPEFAFLQPRHAHFAYFTALVDEYKCFLPEGEEYQKAKDKTRVDAKRERLAHMIADESTSSNDAAVEKRDTISTCLEAAAYRAEYEREMVERRREASAEGGENGIIGGAGTIDWHDFVVIATIEFAADEVVEALPPPTSLRMAVLTKEQPVLAMAEEEQNEAKQETEEISSSDSDVEMDDDGNDDDDEGGEKLKVVSNYQPRVVSTKEITGDSSRTHIIDPISGKSVPIADMPEHMRIQLLDPKWAEERKRFLEKQRETNFVAGEDIASNISRFAKARGDMLFGSSDTNDDSERRLMEANRLIREQHTVVLPGPKPQPILLGMPPPPMGIMPPIFVHPPPPSVMMAQPQLTTFLDEEPAAKRIKVNDSQMMNPPPSSLPPPGTMMILGSEISQPPPPPPTEEYELLSESDFIATLSDPNDVPICIRIPHDPSNSAWNFNGQIQDISAKATTTVKDLKALLKEQLGGMPMNKMQLKHPTTGFMNKDGLSLASLNIGPMTTIDLVPKTRGGRKN